MNKLLKQQETAVSLENDDDNTNTTSGEEALQQVDTASNDQANVTVINAQGQAQPKAVKIRTRTSSGGEPEQVCPLSEDEVKTLEECEDTIKKGMASVVAVAVSFATIKVKALYREKHRSFEEYCRKNYDVGRGRGYQLAAAGEVYKNLSSRVNTPLVDDVAQLLVLNKLPSPDLQIQALNTARETVGDGKLTARVLKKVVDAQQAELNPNGVEASVPAATGKRKAKNAGTTASEPPVAAVSTPVVTKVASPAPTKTSASGLVELSEVRRILSLVLAAISLLNQESTAEDMRDHLEDMQSRLESMIEEAQED